MQNRSFPQRVLMLFVALVVVAAIVLALQPAPVAVDLAVIRREPLVVTVTDDGQTRIRERYIVSAPLAGRLIRIELDPGDDVVAHETLLTAIEPTDSSLLDPRTIAEAEARVNAAEARVKLAKPRLDSAKVAVDLAETELARLESLTIRNATTQQAVDMKRAAFRQAGHDLEAARFGLDIARFELDVAKAALTRTGDAGSNNGWSFPVHSPVSGRVLRVFQESSTVVAAGDRILEIGDPDDLEVVVDLLSTDAVRIRPGSRVSLQQWGGSTSLPGIVRLIEPSAFTKISALGIEEQRVNVLIDFVDDAETRPPLGDGFRVEASVVEWEAVNVLTVPSGALFRREEDWAVFLAVNGRAVLKNITLGHRNDDAAEILDGLNEGDKVILYPGDRVAEGDSIEERTQ